MSNYRKGARFENRVKEHLEMKGWYVVRSAGSHGAADLMAGNRVEIRLIACRTEKARYSKRESYILRRIAKELARSGLPYRAYLAYRDGRPPWTIHLERIRYAAWMPDLEALPPWYSSEAATDAEPE